MKILFIDTHSEKVTMILKSDDGVFKEEKTSDRSHSEIAIPTLEKLLKKSNTDLGEINEIIVVSGPGSFTGTRIGVTIAKTIAYSKNIPIKTITSLEMYGESSSADFDLVCIKDSKGIYSARKQNGEYVDFSYLRKSDFESYLEKNNFSILKDYQIDIEKICEYLKDKEYKNVHLVNPIYIKEIDALK